MDAVAARVLDRVDELLPERVGVGEQLVERIDLDLVEVADGDRYESQFDSAEPVGVGANQVLGDGRRYRSLR